MPETPERHLSYELLDDYFLGESSVGELGTRVLEHLSEVCPDCRRQLEEAPVSFREAFAVAASRHRARGGAIQQERSELPELLSALLPLATSEALVRVALDRRLHTLAFVEHELSIGWAGFEAGEESVVADALTLGYIALRGIDPCRYGREILRPLEAELCLLAARQGLMTGDLDSARAHLLSAGRFLKRAGRPAELGSLELLTAAELRLAQGRVNEARALGSAVAELARRGQSRRWHLAGELLVARIDRLEGRPREAADRLIGLLGEEGPRDREQWSAVREVFFALIEAGEVEEASGWLATWWGEAEAGSTNGRAAGTETWFEAWSERAWAHLDQRAERELILGALLGHLGNLRAARSLLASARRRALRAGRGREAVAATIELLRLHGAGGDLEAVRVELSGLRELALCRDVPRAALRELTLFAQEAWRGRLGDTTRIERALLQLQPGIRRPHGPS